MNIYSIYPKDNPPMLRHIFDGRVIEMLPFAWWACRQLEARIAACLDEQRDRWELVARKPQGTGA